MEKSIPLLFLLLTPKHSQVLPQSENWLSLLLLRPVAGPWVSQLSGIWTCQPLKPKAPLLLLQAQTCTHRARCTYKSTHSHTHYRLLQSPSLYLSPLVSSHTGTHKRVLPGAGPDLYAYLWTISIAMAFPSADLLPSPVASSQVLFFLQCKPRLMIIPLCGSQTFYPTCQLAQLHFHEQSHAGANSPTHHQGSLAPVVAGTRNRQTDGQRDLVWFLFLAYRPTHTHTHTLKSLFKRKRVGN